MSLPKFEYIKVKSIGEVCEALGKYKRKAKVMAGGTDLLVQMKDRVITPEYVIGLRGVEGLGRVVYDRKEGLKIGAMATHREVINSGVARRRYPSLVEALEKIGTGQVRNMGTIGGNICNAAPSADSAPILIALGAEVRIAGANGEREVLLEKVFRGPRKTVLGADEVLVEIVVPNERVHSGSHYEKLFARTSVDLAAVGAACWLIKDGKSGVIKDIKIVLGAVAPVPMRAKKAERVIKGKVVTEGLIKEAGEVAAGESKPISDIRASEEYRREMVKVMVRRAIKGALGRIA